MSDSDWSSSSYDSDNDANGSAEEDMNDQDQGDGAERVLRNADSSSQASLPRNDDDPLTPPMRQRRGRRVSHFASANTNEAIAAYSEALRTTASHRESISTGTTSGMQFLLPEETRRRHRDSKKRLEITERTQILLLKAYELNVVAEDMPLWVHACVIPPRWRQQIMAHLTPIHEQMQFCERHLLQAWNLLLPPFDEANFAEFEARFKLFEKAISLLEAALGDCQQRAIDGEKTAASVFIQLWYRKQLTKVQYS